MAIKHLADLAERMKEFWFTGKNQLKGRKQLAEE